MVSPPLVLIPEALVEGQDFWATEELSHLVCVMVACHFSMEPLEASEQQETEALEEVEEGGTAVEVGVDTAEGMQEAVHIVTAEAAEAPTTSMARAMLPHSIQRGTPCSLALRPPTFPPVRASATALLSLPLVRQARTMLALASASPAPRGPSAQLSAPCRALRVLRAPLRLRAAAHAPIPAHRARILTVTAAACHVNLEATPQAL